MPGRMKLYFNPMSRAVIARWMLEEVGADYEIAPIDFEKDDSRKPDFLAVNPMGKIPTLVLDDGTVLTEAPAIVAWLADAFPDAGLAPAVGSPERGTYYRWLFFGNGAFEPALSTTMMGKDAQTLPRRSVGWGSYDDVVDTVEGALAASPYLLGDRFTAADLYLSSLLGYGAMVGGPRLQASKPIQDYVARTSDRDGWRRAFAESAGRADSAA